LDIQRILSGPEKGLDLQVLLEGLEEQLNLPSVLVDRRYGGSSKFMVVGKEHQFLPLVFIQDYHPAKEIRAVLLVIEASREAAQRQEVDSLPSGDNVGINSLSGLKKGFRKIPETLKF
jgi:hypothetical protein